MVFDEGLTEIQGNVEFELLSSNEVIKLYVDNTFPLFLIINDLVEEILFVTVPKSSTNDDTLITGILSFSWRSSCFINCEYISTYFSLFTFLTYHLNNRRYMYIYIKNYILIYLYIYNKYKFHYYICFTHISNSEIIGLWSLIVKSLYEL